MLQINLKDVIKNVKLQNTNYRVEAMKTWMNEPYIRGKYTNILNRLDWNPKVKRRLGRLKTIYKRPKRNSQGEIWGL